MCTDTCTHTCTDTCIDRPALDGVFIEACAELRMHMLKHVCVDIPTLDAKSGVFIDWMQTLACS